MAGVAAAAANAALLMVRKFGRTISVKWPGASYYDPDTRQTVEQDPVVVKTKAYVGRYKPHQIMGDIQATDSRVLLPRNGLPMDLTKEAVIIDRTKTFRIQDFEDVSLEDDVIVLYKIQARA